MKQRKFQSSVVSKFILKFVIYSFVVVYPSLFEPLTSTRRSMKFFSNLFMLLFIVMAPTSDMSAMIAPVKIVEFVGRMKSRKYKLQGDPPC